MNDDDNERYVAQENISVMARAMRVPKSKD